MDPYRNNLKTYIDAKLSSLNQTLEELEEKVQKIEQKPPKKSWVEAVIHRLPRWEDLFMLIFVGLLLLGVGALIAFGFYGLYMNTQTDNIPDYCSFDYNPDDGWEVIIEREWTLDPQRKGPVPSLQEAKELAKINQCPDWNKVSK